MNLRQPSWLDVMGFWSDIVRHAICHQEVILWRLGQVPNSLFLSLTWLAHKPCVGT
jgi:hypothetical protein